MGEAPQWKNVGPATRSLMIKKETWWTLRIFFIFFLLGGGEGGVRGTGSGRGTDGFY